MAELADALDSGSNGRKAVQVQVLLPAPKSGYKKRYSRRSPRFIGGFAVLYGDVSRVGFVDVKCIKSLFGEL